MPSTMNSFAAALALFLPLGRPILVGLTPAVVIGAAPALADDVLYRQCDINQEIIVTNQMTGKVSRDSLDLPTVYRIDMGKKEITGITFASSSTDPFELQDQTLHISLALDGEELTDEKLTIQLVPPGKVSMKNQVSNQYASSIINTSGTCKEVDASVYEEADALRPKMIRSSDLMTSCWKKKNDGDFKGAILDCDKAVKIYPKNAHAFIERGNAKYFLGDLKGACTDWRKSLELGEKEAAKRVKKHC